MIAVIGNQAWASRLSLSRSLVSLFLGLQGLVPGELGVVTLYNHSLFEYADVLRSANYHV